MKTLKIAILGLLFFSQSCIVHEPFDYSLLDTKYYTVFCESLDQVVFDHIALSSNGYFGTGKLNRFLYKSDLLDTLCDRRMVLIHDWEGGRITSSSIDTTYYNTEDYNENYKIVWDINEYGIIVGATRYNSENRLLSTEKYDFEVFPSAYDAVYHDQWLEPLCRIKERSKYNSRGQFIQRMIFTYHEDGTFEIETIERKNPPAH